MNSNFPNPTGASRAMTTLPGTPYDGSRISRPNLDLIELPRVALPRVQLCAVARELAKFREVSADIKKAAGHGKGLVGLTKQMFPL
jgi:hypothetical protein